MTEIKNFVETFLSAPLQLVLILLFLGIFVYWFLKERPKEIESQEKLINTVREDSQEERKNFFKIMDDYRVQNEKISAMYDKALENSTRAIENNTETIKNQNVHIQLTNQALQTLNDSALKVEENIEKVKEATHTLQGKVQEVIILCNKNNQ